jgi:hypothetical protein
MPANLKPQDVLVACHLALLAGEWPTHAVLGVALHLSSSTVFASLKNLRASRLVVGAEPAVDKPRLLSFLVYGVPSVFFPRKTHIMRGTPTGIFSPAFRDRFTRPGDVPVVWPYARGKEEGEGLLPLYPTVASACSKNPGLYQLMAAVDVLRSGRSREREAAVRYVERAFNVTLEARDGTGDDAGDLKVRSA